MGEIIPCIHNNYLTKDDNLTPKACPKILISLCYRDITRLVYHHHDDDNQQNKQQQVTYVPLFSTQSPQVWTNPFCPDCKADVVSSYTAVGMGSSTSTSTHQIESIFLSLRNEARGILQRYKQQGRRHVGGGRGNVIGEVHLSDIVRYHDQYCSSIEEVNEWLAWANELLEGGPKKKAATWAVAELERVDCEVAGEEDDDDCVVCLEGLKTKKGVNKVVKMPCHHVFHEDCILTWLHNSHLCPLCRFQLPLEA
ncbi:hypothetical protein vseg_003082 [Gypsophila vaccaria]